MEKVVFISDGGPDVGGGHISRCKSLAYAFKALCECQVWWIVPEEAVAFLNEACSVPDSSIFMGDPSPNIFSLLKESRLIVVDSYRIGCSVLDRLRFFAPLIVIDDYRDRPVDYHSDVVLNYNIGAESVGYDSDSASCLLGPSYALLRPSFSDVLVEDKGYYFFVAGSYDLMKTSLPIVKWWDLSWPPLKVILGPMNEEEYVRQVLSAAVKKDNLSILIAPENFDELMANSSGVLCTSSVTSYEALALGKPLIVFQVAENQRNIGQEIGRLNWGINLGWWSKIERDDLKNALMSLHIPPTGCVNLNGAKKAAKAILRETRSFL